MPKHIWTSMKQYDNAALHCEWETTFLALDMSIQMRNLRESKTTN